MVLQVKFWIVARETREAFLICHSKNQRASRHIGGRLGELCRCLLDRFDHMDKLRKMLVVRCQLFCLTPQAFDRIIVGRIRGQLNNRHAPSMSAYFIETVRNELRFLKRIAQAAQECTNMVAIVHYTKLAANQFLNQQPQFARETCRLRSVTQSVT